MESKKANWNKPLALTRKSSGSGKLNDRATRLYARGF
jgi:hypothetical protein